MIVAALLVSALAGVVPSTVASSADWSPLIRAGDFDRARSLCSGWLKLPDNSSKAEGHKCLANVELYSGGEHKILLQGNGQGGGSIGTGYDADRALRALEHLDVAVKLAPQDLSIHQGRLHVLELGAMYERMRTSLEQSVRLYRGKDALGAWIAYPAELFQANHPKEAESLLLLLDKYYPGDHRVAGNLATVYAVMERDEQALAWAKKAVAAAPNDPIDTWNLGRIYDFTGKIELADAAYQRALPLQLPSQRSESTCLYAEFLEKRKKDLARACDLQRHSGCSTSACTP